MKLAQIPRKNSRTVLITVSYLQKLFVITFYADIEIFQTLILEKKLQQKL